MERIAVAGGSRDPNLDALIRRARRRSIPTIDLRVGLDTTPSFEWDVHSGRTLLDREECRASGVFIRYDVFSSLEHPSPDVASCAAGWFTSMHAWAIASSARLFNRDAAPVSALKPAVLALARQCGLSVPPTRVTNDLESIAGREDLDDWVAKPVGGGDYCRSLKVLESAHLRRSISSIPGIVQQRLVSPELRLYVVGKTSIAFALDSPSLDYRERQDAKIREVEVPAHEDAGLRRLMSAMRMDFGAADFKRDPDSGAWHFLELNTSPMFALFDELCEGRISDAILEELIHVDRSL